ncbi:MAG: ankyrin repeat domain-containing protein [Alphaproteobacteria bacterium]|nr:ankyrin repeat domain-containing protein [Alphaproteobacteria bacterium]
MSRHTPFQDAAKPPDLGRELAVLLAGEYRPQADKKDTEKHALELIRMGADPNVRSGKEDTTPLMLAAAAGLPCVVKALIDAGAEVNAYDRSQRNALLWMSLGSSLECAEILLAAGANPNVRSSTGMMPLMCAADPRFAAMLVDAGARIDTKNDFGLTPLHYAASKGAPATVSFLLQKGADKDVRDKRGWTPMDYAAHRKHEEIIAVLRGELVFDATDMRRNGINTGPTSQELQNKLKGARRKFRLG